MSIFSKKKDISSLIGEGVTLRGDLEFSGGIRVDGKIEGDLISRSGPEPSFLLLGPEGVVEGDVTVENAVINGKVTGNLTVSDSLTLLQNAVVSGKIHYGKFNMEQGATIHGLVSKIGASTESKEASETLLADLCGDLATQVRDLASGRQDESDNLKISARTRPRPA